MGFLSKVGGAFKKVGKGALWGIKRPEARIAVSFIPGAAPVKEVIKAVIPVVVALDSKKLSNTQKMNKALKDLKPLLYTEFNIKKGSETRFLIELAIQMLRGGISLDDDV